MFAMTVAAPTGLAARNVDGVTVYRLFQLPNSWILATVKGCTKSYAYQTVLFKADKH